LPLESVGPSKARCTVPAAIIDCVTKLQLLMAVREGGQYKVMKHGNNANTQTVNCG
jgi:hypothetical protein